MHNLKKRRLSSHSADLKKGSSSMSEKQRSLMLDFLSDHPSMILDRSVGGTPNKPNNDQLWESMAVILNSCGSGAEKSGCGWRRSWQDLKRYESLKAKESMAELGKVTEKLNQPPMLILSPLQEKIANLLNTSISDVAECVNPDTSNETQQKPAHSSEKNQDSTKPLTCDRNTFCQASGETQVGETSATDINIAQALQNVACALTERNAIEEKKLRVFENLLTVYAAKNGIALAEAVNDDRDRN